MGTTAAIPPTNNGTITSNVSVSIPVSANATNSTPIAFSNVTTSSTQPLTTTATFTCNNGDVISMNKVCNGIVDCPGDCDDVNDCPGGEDEDGCPGTNTTVNLTNPPTTTNLPTGVNATQNLTNPPTGVNTTHNSTNPPTTTYLPTGVNA